MAKLLLVGASRGIGLSLAKIYAERGDGVLATCRARSAELDAIPSVHVVPDIDVARADAGDRLVEALGSTKVDLLIIVAGILEADTLDTLDVASVERQLAVNAVGPLRIASALARRVRDGGKIALMTSRMGSIEDNTSGGYYGYRMSKAALNAAGKSLALDLAPRGVSVAILHPGFVRTRMT
jgi:NAD(P)-dependent dehydrogenase (short-subunit alcohol dehydrogenase family)